ncbi:MAG: CoA transferase [Alphaproteobacteria bacterium]|nr:CoA transferase [Alphaproteobacteria bacterium]
MKGVRVLDLTLNLPGPYATWVLACMGADVVKLEPPKGDPARHMGDLFGRLNRGKRSVVLDLRDPASKPHLEKLLAWADVVVEGFRPGVTERLGCGPAEAHALNPRLVYCRISAFGQGGPRRLEPGHDLNLQALTGLCHMERGRDGEPRANVLPVADLSTSLAAVSAIGGALLGDRDRTVLDVSMADALLSWTWTWDAVDPGLQLDAATRKAPPPVKRLLGPMRRRLERDRLYAMPQYGLYRAKDGWIALGVVDEQHFWEKLADVLGMKRVRKLAMPVRTVLGPLLRPRIAQRLRGRTVADWMRRMTEAGVPVTPVNTVAEAVREPQFARVVQDGVVLPPIPGARVPEGPAPALGQHTDEVLGAL